jgi:hypothetical protein
MFLKGGLNKMAFNYTPPKTSKGKGQCVFMIPLDERAQRYYPPEILTALPDDISTQERELVEALDRNRFGYVISGELRVLAGASGNNVGIQEFSSNGKPRIELILQNPDPILEGRMRILAARRGYLLT